MKAFSMVRLALRQAQGEASFVPPSRLWRFPGHSLSRLPRAGGDPGRNVKSTKALQFNRRSDLDSRLRRNDGSA